MDRKELVSRFRSAEIILFGAGDYAKQLYRDFGADYHIVKCITNNPREHVFEVDGKEVCPVCRVEEGLKQAKAGSYMVCASANPAKMEEQLWRLGYAPGKDFCNSDIFRLLVSDKKIAVSYGVCYMRALYNCLEKSLGFSEDYEIFYSLSYLERNAVDDFFLKFLIGICDLYLYNATLSPEERMKQEELLHYLPIGSKRVGIPVIASSAYYPQAGDRSQWGNPYGIVSSQTHWGSFLSGDHNINRMLEEGRSTDEIVETLMDDEYYSASWLEENYKKEMIGIQVSESIADITISDFLRDNRGKKRLFLNESHISNEVILQLARRILKHLGYADDLPEEEILLMQLLNTSEVPLYPSVIRGLNLTVYAENDTYRLFTFQGMKVVTFEEYLRLYCDYCGNMMRFVNMGYFPNVRR